MFLILEFAATCNQSNQAQNPNESPLYADVRHMDDDEDGDPEPPPSAPPISPEEETTQNNPFSFSSTPNATMRQASHERYIYSLQRLQ